MILLSQPWVGRLGATLLHFLWQGLAIAVVYAAARRGATRPMARYLLGCAALAAMAAACLITWLLLAPPTPAAVIATFAQPLFAAPPAPGPAGFMLPTAIGHAVPAAFLPAVVAVWLTGSALLWLRLVGGWILAARLRSRFVRPAPPEWQHLLRHLAARIGVARPVQLLVSALVQAPFVFGWLRPVVLVPAAALTGLPAAQLEALLLHELAHIRRHDYLVNALQSVVESLLFYHPAVWWISGHIRAERELCCDDVAVALTGDPLSYARALAGLTTTAPLTALGANGGALSHRIARLLGQTRPAAYGAQGTAIVVTAALLAFTLFAQPAERPKFEAASVKIAGPSGMQMVRPQPGRLTASASVRLLIQNAWSVQQFQIAGGPGWIDDERYQIEAKAAGNATRAQIFLMLQSLLEERFQLKIHHETRDVSGFALVAARGGIKLPAPKEGSCIEPAPAPNPEWSAGRMPAPGQGPVNPPDCGSPRVALQTSGAYLQGGRIAMPALVRTLSMILARPVVDRTAHSGLFDLELRFLPDQTTAAIPPPPPGSPISEDNTPNILAALPEQLGLRLEASRNPVDVIVIDRIERPAAN